MRNFKNRIYPRTIAAEIINEFEYVLEQNDIVIPDEDRTGDEGEACLYGMTYGNLIDAVERQVTDVLKELKAHPDSEIVENIFG